MTKKLTTSLFAIAAITAAGFGFNSLNNETPSDLANAPITQNTEEQQIAFDPISRGESCWIRDYEPVPCPSDSWNAEELNAFEAEEQIAFDLTPCHQKRPGYRWGYGIFGTTCAWEGNSEELNAFEAEELIAMVGNGMWIWEGWTSNEEIQTDAETQLAFDHRPCHQKRPGWDWGHGIFGTICVRRAGEELNAFEAEELIAWEPPTKCYTRRDRQEEVPCPFNTEELNAFDAKDLTV